MRSVNEHDVSSSCILLLFLFLLHMLDFFFLNLSISLYYDEKTWRKNVGLAETSQLKYREADDSICRSCMLCCISMNVYYVKLDFWSLMEELGHFLFTFYLGENYFYLLRNLRFDGKVIKSYCYYFFFK